MHEFGVDDDGTTRQGAKRCGESGEACRPVGALAGIERDRVAGFMDLQTVPVELDLIDPAVALGEAITGSRFTWLDKRKGKHAPCIHQSGIRCRS